VVLRFSEFAFVGFRRLEVRGALAIALEQRKMVRKDLYATATGLS
jgi:hypothetical protein